MLLNNEYLWSGRLGTIKSTHLTFFLKEETRLIHKRNYFARQPYREVLREHKDMQLEANVIE